MTAELIKWIKENKELLNSTNEIELIAPKIAPRCITEFLIYIRQKEALNELRVIWDTESPNKFYQVRCIAYKYNELILERIGTDIYPSFASREMAINSNTWASFKTLKDYTDFMISFDKGTNNYIGTVHAYPLPVNTKGLKEIDTYYGKCFVSSAGYAQLNK